MDYKQREDNTNYSGGSNSRLSHLLKLYITLALMIVILISVTANTATSSPILLAPQDQNSYNDLVENFITDFLDGDRLKKSKMNGMRQVKQTLRFGRSDPWFTHGIPEKSMSLEELGSNQRLYELNN